MARQIVEVETKTFIRFWLVIFGFGLAIFFIVRAAEALAVIGIAALLAIAIRPLAQKVDRLVGKKPQNNLASILAYLIVILALAAIVAVIAPAVISETAKFISSLPTMISGANLSGINSIGSALGISNLTADFVAAVEDFSKNFLSSFGTSFVASLGTVGSIIGKVGLTLILTLFFLLDGPVLINSLWDKLGAKKSVKDIKEEKDSEVKALTEARIIVTKMTRVVSSFVSNQVSIALMDGLATALSVFVLSLIFGTDTKLAIPLGLITGTFYLIPMFGQVIGAVLVTLILLFSHPLMAVIWLVFYVVYGFIEVNVFAPKIQGNSLNLRPVIILIAITIGTYTFGLFGAIIAIPIAGCIKVVIDEYPHIRNLRSK
ncbi:AI-2E family transporter [Candidatus Saccharibacteria bacterium]|nr:AI-2E family transporter [Candidatus Saccharibacteria bacterium]